MSMGKNTEFKNTTDSHAIANWISVKDKLPEVDYVLGQIPNRRNLVTEVCFNNGKWFFAEGYRGQKETIIVECEVSHWQLLPEPVSERQQVTFCQLCAGALRDFK